MSEQVDFRKLDDKERVAFLVKEAERHPEQASGILDIAFRQGLYVTSQLQASNCGFYNIFKLHDVMSDAGLNDRERFDSLLCRLRDEEQIQLHTGDVTVHTPEENEKGFIDENGYRMGTFTLSRAPEAFRMTEESLMRVLGQKASTQEKTQKAYAPEIGDKVEFSPHQGNVKLKGKVVALTEETVTLRSGNKDIPIFRDKGVFSGQKVVAKERAAGELCRY